MTPARALAIAALLLASVWMHAARAQAGPPMITNDPDTPGAGVWEINTAATGGRTRDAWDFAAPDVDVNLGVGDRVQLSVHGAWQHVRADGAPWSSGWGDVELGARWRFLDDETDGVSMAVQPLWIKNWSSSARRRGLASEHAEYVLPVQIAHDLGTVAGGMEIARHFVASEPDAWQIGAYVERDCFKASECLGEIVTEHTNGESTRTTLNFGGRVPLTTTLKLLASIGSELSGEDRQQLVFYLGVQYVQ